MSTHITVEPSSPNIAIVTANFEAFSAEQLFLHFTQEELITRWWPQTAVFSPVIVDGTYVSNTGGTYQFDWPAMNWTLRGTYLGWGWANSLTFTWQWDHEPDRPMRVVLISFTELEKGCNLHLTHGVYGSDEAEQADRQSHIDGWTHFLGQLAALTP